MLFWENRVRNFVVLCLIAALMVTPVAISDIAYAAELEETEIEIENEVFPVDENEVEEETADIDYVYEKSEERSTEKKVVKATEEAEKPETEEEQGGQEGEESSQLEYEITTVELSDSKYDALEIKFHGELIKKVHVLILVKQVEGKYQYFVVDPLEDRVPEDTYLVYEIDEKGKALPCKETNILYLSNFLWKATEGSENSTQGSIEQVDTLFYVVDGQLLAREETEIVFVNVEGQQIAYLVKKDGQAELLTGVFEDYYYENGVIKLSESPYYQIVDGYLYYVNTEGLAELVIKDDKNSGTYLKRINNIIYKISYKTGRLIKYCGLYKGYFYKDGVIAKGKTFYVVDKSYIYKVSTSGKAKVYTKKVKKKKKDKSYYAVVFTSDLKYYLYSIKAKTGKVKKYVKSKSKAGNYMYVKGNRAYKISYKTGEVTAFFSGIYKNKLYVKGNYTKKTGIYYGYYVYKGEVVKKTGSYYIVFGGFVYKVSKTGQAKIYIKNPNKEGTYTYVKGGYRYTIEYQTGVVVAAETLTDDDMRQILVDKAVSYLGYSEAAKGAKSHVKILDIYNAYRPLPRSYKVTKYDAWCATYVSAMFIALGYDKIMPIECSCFKQVEMWKNMGRWKESDSYVPKPGDIIYYDWQDSGRGDNKGVPDHVGIVVSSTSKIITVIEGNKNDRVEYRTIKVNGRFIRGFGLPNYYSLLK